MQVAASPVVNAIFVNSPLESGRFSGALSRRLQLWSEAEPERSGLLEVALRKDFVLEDFVEWALGLKMLYRKRDGLCEPGPERSFRTLLQSGFADGTYPTGADWRQHLDQIWTDVRVRNTLELRGADGPTSEALAALPALWSGLTYDRPTRDEALALFAGRSVDEHRAAMREVSLKGLAASHGNEPVRELADELLRLSRAGLSARVDAGLEDPEAIAFLETIAEVVTSGTTFAERCLRDWYGPLGQRPDRYVSRYRI